MTVKYKLEGLACPVCAGKVEKLIGAVDGIAGVKVNFIAGRITVECAEMTAALEKAVMDAVHGFQADLTVTPL